MKVRIYLKITQQKIDKKVKELNKDNKDHESERTHSRYQNTTRKLQLLSDCLA